MRYMTFIALLFSSMLLICANIDAEESKETVKFWPLLINGEEFLHIELARTHEEMSRGLMNRSVIAEDGGMIFILGEPPMIHDFWMKNTRIPLDIIFLDSDYQILAIYTMKTELPRQEDETEESYESRLPLYSSRAPASYALEIKAGKASLLGLKVGDVLPLYLP